MNVVVVGVDGSPNSRSALRVAIAEAVWREAKVHAVHVVHFPAAMGFDPLMIDYDTIKKAGSAVLEAELSDVEAEYPDGFPVEVESSVRLGHTGIEIMAAVDDEQSERVLTVVGSRGMGGFVGLLIGSVTNYLVHHLSGPLLVVPTSSDARKAEALEATT